jgi:hypothetical protein
MAEATEMHCLREAVSYEVVFCKDTMMPSLVKRWGLFVSSGVDKAPADAAEGRRVSGSYSQTYRVLESVVDSVGLDSVLLICGCYEMWEELLY